MSTLDRGVSIALVIVAAGAWLAVGVLVTSASPVGDPSVQLSGALLMGGAVCATLWPALWWLTTIGGRDPGSGSWPRAGRRAALAGLVVTILIVMRGLPDFGLPLVLFVMVIAVLIELALSMRTR